MKALEKEGLRELQEREAEGWTGVEEALESHSQQAQIGVCGESFRF